MDVVRVVELGAFCPTPNRAAASPSSVARALALLIVPPRGRGSVEALHEDQKPINLPPEEEETFRDASHCHICQQSLDGRIRVRDHCHLTGRFRGDAHEECNLNYQHSRTIPVIFHNLSGYDSHLIIKQISTCVDGRIDLLLLTMERYVFLTKHNVGSKVTLRFIDSFRFMASSLEKLASYLDTDRKTIVKREFARQGTVKATHEKGVFPYDYLHSWAKLDKVELPPTEAFHSALNNSDISAEDYAREYIYIYFATSP